MELTIEDKYEYDDKDFEELIDGQQMGEDNHSAYYEEITIVLDRYHHHPHHNYLANGILSPVDDNKNNSSNTNGVSVATNGLRRRLSRFESARSLPAVPEADRESEHGSEIQRTQST